MTVTSLIPDNCVLDGDIWVLNHPSDEEVIKQLKDLDKNFSTKYFLNFAWGVFVTAYARKNLFKCALGYDDKGIQHTGTENGFNCCYFDTDSIFCLGRPDYEWYNIEIQDKLKNCCKVRALDYAQVCPKDIKGKIHPLGEFDTEEDIKAFKCLHAKAYLERRFDDKLYMTVSGINKDAVQMLNDNMDNFCDGFNFDKDHPSVRKLIPTHIINQPTLTFPDGYRSTFKYGKNLRPTGYKLSQTDEYKDLIRCIELQWFDLSESQIRAFRKGI